MPTTMGQSRSFRHPAPVPTVPLTTGVAPRGTALTCVLAATMIFAGVVLLGRPALDQRLLEAVLEADVPGLGGISRALFWFAGSGAAVVLWAMAMGRWTIGRHWARVVVALAVPLSLVLGTVLGHMLAARPLPHVSVWRIDAALLQPIAGVMSSISLLGFLAMLGVPSAWPGPMKLGARLTAGATAVLLGLSYLWFGALWPLDLAMAYALSAGLLLTALVIHPRLSAAVDGLPLVHAGHVLHDESLPHAHALTSTILFEGDRVAKIYRPGLLPRALFWLAFQAPFAYEVNETALRACLFRRNLAGHLTRYWYGTNRVAPAIAVERVGGRLALVSTFIDGREPEDHAAVRAFLSDLSNHFDDVGLPTWQIDPRQPRSLGNVLQCPDGSFTIIDLESGLVSPLASPRAWWRALRRALVPFYDDVYFDLTRDYIEREEASLRSACGDDWFTELVDLLNQAEAETWAWHQSEPRVWSRLARAVQPELGRPPTVLPDSDEGARL